jgi:hypothetical protein
MFVYVLIEGTISAKLTSLIELLMTDQLSEMIQKQVAVLDVPSLPATADVGHPSKVNENIPFEQLLSKGSQRRTLTSSHYIQFSKIADGVYSS